jgi:hypothetical protein
LMDGGCPPVANLANKVLGALDEEKKYLFIVGSASLIEMWFIATMCDDASYCEKMWGWGVAAGVISLVVCLAIGIGGHFVPAIAGVTKFVAIGLALWWIVALVTLTMPNKDNPGPFIVASNGFFGTWVAMIGSIALAAQCWGMASGDVGSMMGGGGGGGDTGGSAGTSEPTAVTSNPAKSDDAKSDEPPPADTASV